MISKKFLGIDIGTSFIKIVEVSGRGERKKLENYGEISSLALYEKPFRTFEKSSLVLSNQDISRAISAIIAEAKIQTKEVAFSLPDFSSFFTNFELPLMTKEELPQAVKYEARQHVPLPLSEVTLDWQVVGGKTLSPQKTSSESKLPPEQAKLKILLIAVPNEVINQYQAIANLVGLKLFALEAEVFALLRALIQEDQKTVALVDIGSRSTTCSIIENQILKTSHSFDISGDELTEQIAKSLSIDDKTAEILKKKIGLQPSEEKSREILLPLVDFILREIEKIFSNFYQAEKKEIQKVIIAGGTALLPGLKEYFAANLKKEIETANPFTNLFYPPILEKTLQEMGPSYAIAVGTALRGLE